MATPGKQRTRHRRKAQTGLGQLTLVEHALCPLDPRAALQENLRHHSEYRHADANGRMQTAAVMVHCPAGLSAGDEFYLWGLLALTFAQPEPRIDFHATPHFCLRKLGLISAESKGGKSYRLFRESLRRLSAVRYQNERFYDPIRREHRAVSFGFFGYSLPLDPDSSRAWRIVWDPLFFEYCQAVASQLRFDLGMYRSLDHASRRLFLLLSKVFWRSPLSPHFDVRHLAVHVLGFSGGLASRTLKAKVKHCVDTLRQHEVLAPTNGAAAPTIRRQGKGRYVAQFVRGAYFDYRQPRRKAVDVKESPLHDPLSAIGFDMAAIQRILARFPVEQVQVWADVTLAAVEHKGHSFFRRSPQAFFMDNIQHAVRGNRTLPDWFQKLRKMEQQRRAENARRKRKDREPTIEGASAVRASVTYRALDLGRSLDEVAADMAIHFLAAGESEPDAKRNAQRFAVELARVKRCLKGK